MSAILPITLALVISALLFLWSIDEITDDTFVALMGLIALGTLLWAFVKMLLPFMGIEIWYGA